MKTVSSSTCWRQLMPPALDWPLAMTRRPPVSESWPQRWTLLWGGAVGAQHPFPSHLAGMMGNNLFVGFLFQLWGYNLLLHRTLHHYGPCECAQHLMWTSARLLTWTVGFKRFQSAVAAQHFKSFDGSQGSVVQTFSTQAIELVWWYFSPLFFSCYWFLGLAAVTLVVLLGRFPSLKAAPLLFLFLTSCFVDFSLY